MSRRGLTLIEILVALVISSIAGTIAFLLLRDEHANYGRLRSRIKMQSDARDAVRLLEGELLNTGLSTANIYSGRDLSTLKCPLAFVAPGDSSSFLYTNRTTSDNPGDEIVFAQYHADAFGTVTCHNTNVHYLRYRLDSSTGTLLRATARSVAALDSADDIPLLANVLAFQLQYGIQHPDSILWDSTTTPGSAGLSVGGSSAGWDLGGWSTAQGSAWIGPARTLPQGSRLRVEFRSTPNDSFADSTRGWGRFAVGLFQGSTLQDTIGVVPGNSSGRKVMVELVASTALSSARLGIIGRMRTDLSSPSIRISGLVVKQASLPSYRWVDAPSQVQKRQVRAIRLFLLVRSNEKSLPAAEAQWENVGDLPPIDPGVSSSGKASALFERIIPVVNNGF